MKTRVGAVSPFSARDKISAGTPFSAEWPVLQDAPIRNTKALGLPTRAFTVGLDGSPPGGINMEHVCMKWMSLQSSQDYDKRNDTCDGQFRLDSRGRA